MTEEARALVYCQGALATTYGKTAHGLVRRSRRYRVMAVIDREHAGRDAAEVMGDPPSGIPVVAELEEAISHFRSEGTPVTHLVIGVAPDGGRLDAAARADVKLAIENGLEVHCGLHDFLSEDTELAAAAQRAGVALVDVRKPPPRRELHFFSGKIEEVDCLKVALLGTDSAVGKRTTAWLLIDALEAVGRRAELIGTGQTAWLQGSKYGLILDSLVNDFLSGEIEHAVWSAWSEQKPDVIVLEGQGSLMNPAYPGGFELLAAGRPDAVILQHAPARLTYDGFPRHPMHPIEKQIEAIELISAKPVIAITLNHEQLDSAGVARARRELESRTGLPVVDPLRDGCQELVDLLVPLMKSGD